MGGSRALTTGRGATAATWTTSVSARVPWSPGQASSSGEDTNVVAIGRAHASPSTRQFYALGDLLATKPLLRRGAHRASTRGGSARPQPPWPLIPADDNPAQIDDVARDGAGNGASSAQTRTTQAGRDASLLVSYRPLGAGSHAGAYAAPRVGISPSP